MSEYKKLMDKLEVYYRIDSNAAHDLELRRRHLLDDLPPTQSSLDIRAFYADEAQIRRHLVSKINLNTPHVAIDTECFESLFRKSMKETMHTMTIVSYDREWPAKVGYTEDYTPKVSKFGKRERNKIQVPVKEKQIVNSNSHTKKRKKRK